MTPLIAFRTGKKDPQGSLLEIHSPAAIPGAAPVAGVAGTANPSRAADYAYRIAAVTAGLVLLATVM